jgi:hypothetical protein
MVSLDLRSTAYLRVNVLYVTFVFVFLVTCILRLRDCYRCEALLINV